MNLPTFLTLLVAFAFAALLILMLRPGARERFEPYARMPLDDDAGARRAPIEQADQGDAR
jgi:cbb3-type cytochrome oxidase subunit 3